MEQLKACYEKYIAEAEEIWKSRPAWDGLLGLTASVNDHPCHVAFLRAVEAWVDGFLKGDPDRETAEAAMAYVLQTSEAYKGKFTYWSMYAAHGMVRPLVSVVSPKFAAETRAWYEANIRRVDRLPVQKDLLKLLKKRERE